MAKHIKHILGCLLDQLDHYLVINLLLALVILSRVGVGNAKIVSLLGLLLCSAGLLQSSVRVDLWTFVPLIVYNAVSTISFYVTYKSMTDGYGSTQTLYSVLYLIMAYLTADERLLLKRLCTIWTGIVAFVGIGQFVARVLIQQRAWRVGGFLGNPNAMGIFLVIGWFSLLNCTLDQNDRPQQKTLLLPYLEPILLIALALTLSMGSFIAMAAGILVLVLEKKKQSSLSESIAFACRLLAGASLGIGTGILIYLTAARTAVPFFCLPLLVYAAVLVYCWKTYRSFLAEKPRMAALISILGILVAAAAVALRPSSLATFAERLEMMQNGLSYFAKNPLLGVGPYQWRILNLHDSSKYFNTWHIHNVFIHVGVEQGWIALAMLLIIAVRFYRKIRQPSARAGFTAFCFHNMIDTSFFYMGIFSLTMLAFGNPAEKAQKLHTGIVKAIFALSMAIFAYTLYCSIRAV